MIDNLFCLNICFVQLAPKNQKEKYKRNKIIIKKDENENNKQFSYFRWIGCGNQLFHATSDG